MAIHRFKCSDDLNKEIILFSQFHKFDSKDNLVEQFDSWIKEEKIEKLIIKEEKFLQTNQYDGDITIKLFKSINLNLNMSGNKNICIVIYFLYYKYQLSLS